ncbi:TetR family transcriptional regulator [Prauserella shujinwangii]|uniref:TetR family transcriptional regulator n=1 Tax=Prauserella shujinwangii TaxID=1453103 RepID=A0A2T0M2N6_9PSEU|nr:TetR/AcrR family transcriptional regulator [Prauserella shujinwangii]PRX51015.1 TetR family transcriptional regulator [Prauserella shujinwangii]
MGKWDRTHERIQRVALELFERHGFEATTVARIAAAAQVTEMTFFRHFRSKERLVLDDPYDPLIATAIAAQPLSLGPLRRAARGVREAWSRLDEPDSDLVRRRVRIVAGSPALRAAAWRDNEATQRLIVEQLVAGGTEPLRAEAAGAAVLAAITAALYAWARDDDRALASAVLGALDTLDGGNG